MKLEKNERTPYIMKTTKHFNDVSTRGGFLSRTLRPSMGASGCGFVPLSISLSFSPYQGGWPQEGAPPSSLLESPWEGAGREDGGPRAMLLISTLTVVSEAGTLGWKMSDFPLSLPDAEAAEVLEASASAWK